MIRKATASDIDSIVEISKACAQHMIDNKIFQWNADYPNKHAFEEDLNQDQLYVTATSDSVMGCVVISEIMDEEYKAIDWLTPSGNQFYIHRLAVHPDLQGQGLAQELMAFAENLGRKENMDSIRLDTFSKNERNQKFYEQRGYKRLGNIYFPKQSVYPFYCYELIL
ncbi:MAG: GNAT family N-acetyltransferase [Flavobacteriaceae bacterium]|nr:MAG: GNAT family N-acetyltransferase [Flavobacteriaceae bacterium]